jgi:hypothetical protein
MTKQKSGGRGRRVYADPVWMYTDPRQHEWSTQGGRRVHELHPNQAREMALAFHRKYPGQATINGKKGGRKGGLIGGKLGGHVAGLKNAASGHLARIASSGGKVGGRRNVESGQMARAQAKSRYHQDGPNKHEQVIYDELGRLIGFVPIRGSTVEVPIGVDGGIADIVIGKVIGEYDGPGHWANRASAQGVSADEWISKMLRKDQRHDMVRRQMGYVVVRGGDPLELANKLASLVRKDSGEAS